VAGAGERPGAGSTAGTEVPSSPGSSSEGASTPDPVLQPLGPAGEQGSLFPDDLFEESLHDEVLGYRGPAACQIVGITYRQLDYWARTKLVVPSIRTATGSGSQRLYSFKDLAVLKVVKNLLDTGVSLNNIRSAVEQLRRHGVRDLARITLFSDGVTVYECTSPEEVVDLLQGGQGVFGIAVGGAMRELSGSIAHFPAERAGAGAAVVDQAPEDELASRRNRGARSAG
jgi:DNA-binding transcriptional MerR regulator